jgi:hypothetical protein
VPDRHNVGVVRGSLALLLAVAVAAGGCGGGDKDGSSGQTAATPEAPAVVTLTTPKETIQLRPAPTGKPTFTIVLSGDGHTAPAGESWPFTVTAKDAAGKPTFGTAKMHVFVGTQHVDTLGWFPFEGKLSKTHTWPAALRGKKDVVLQAEVEGDGGTQRQNWPMRIG